MAFLDSTGELTDEARAAFMEAMIEEEDSEEEDEVKYCYLGLVNFGFGQFWGLSRLDWPIELGPKISLGRTGK